ncbi:12421_t:CDS:2 [Gigaspora rosea]|nr:12421_t:CDS:2 [Gigaspora rosea]
MAIGSDKVIESGDTILNSFGTIYELKRLIEDSESISSNHQRPILLSYYHLGPNVVRLGIFDFKSQYLNVDGD